MVVGRRGNHGKSCRGAEFTLVNRLASTLTQEEERAYDLFCKDVRNKIVRVEMVETKGADNKENRGREKERKEAERKRKK